MAIADIKFLVIEDDEFQRQMVVRMLRMLGVMSIHEVANGRQALETFHGANAQPVDIAICDLDMPEMDGMEFLRHLGQKQHDISIIISSAQKSKLLDSVGKMTLAYGFKLLGVIEKPVTRELLKELISKRMASISSKLPSTTAATNFSLEETLQGISANQFEPYYQPQVDLNTGQVIGAEALARWIHPDRGVIGPHAFIPSLEQSGNMNELTFVLLKKIVSNYPLIKFNGRPFSVSVNLSIACLSDTGLADRITKIVRKSGINPQDLTLEITESVAISDIAAALENLTRLSMRGFSLSIDDYGTGFSSLQQLTRIPFNELKIDQSFVKNFSGNEELRIVVESSIDMAHKLNVRSVAEGVENLQDWDTLKSMKCDIAQGYFIARPMDTIAFNEYMASFSVV